MLKLLMQFFKLFTNACQFGLIPTSDQEQSELLELMEYRYGQTSTIFCSQFIPEGWHEWLSEGALTDSFLDVLSRQHIQ